MTIARALLADPKILILTRQPHRLIPSGTPDSKAMKILCKVEQALSLPTVCQLSKKQTRFWSLKMVKSSNAKTMNPSCRQRFDDLYNRASLWRNKQKIHQFITGGFFLNVEINKRDFLWGKVSKSILFLSTS